VARHSARAALRALAADGLVMIEPNRGATIARLDVRSLFELRAALELEAAYLALERHDGRVPNTVRAAVARLADTCARSGPAWVEVSAAHNEVHTAIVRAAASERIARVYDTLAGEMRLFVMSLKPHWSLERMAEQHEELIEGLERDGPPALRAHLMAGQASVLESGGPGRW
jgi:DNA-binding GntR family transcriptional regulator